MQNEPKINYISFTTNNEPRIIEFTMVNGKRVPEKFCKKSYPHTTLSCYSRLEKFSDNLTAYINRYRERERENYNTIILNTIKRCLYARYGDNLESSQSAVSVKIKNLQELSNQLYKVFKDIINGIKWDHKVLQKEIERAIDHFSLIIALKKLYIFVKLLLDKNIRINNIRYYQNSHPQPSDNIKTFIKEPLYKHNIEIDINSAFTQPELTALTKEQKIDIQILRLYSSILRIYHSHNFSIEYQKDGVFHITTQTDLFNTNNLTFIDKIRSLNLPVANAEAANAEVANAEVANAGAANAEAVNAGAVNAGAVNAGAVNAGAANAEVVNVELENLYPENHQYVRNCKLNYKYSNKNMFQNNKVILGELYNPSKVLVSETESETDINIIPIYCDIFSNKYHKNKNNSSHYKYHNTYECEYHRTNVSNIKNKILTLFNNYDHVNGLYGINDATLLNIGNTYFLNSIKINNGRNISQNNSNYNHDTLIIPKHLFIKDIIPDDIFTKTVTSAIKNLNTSVSNVKTSMKQVKLITKNTHNANIRRLINSLLSKSENMKTKYETTNRDSKKLHFVKCLSSIKYPHNELCKRANNHVKQATTLYGNAYKLGSNKEDIITQRRATLASQSAAAAIANQNIKLQKRQLQAYIKSLTAYEHMKNIYKNIAVDLTLSNIKEQNKSIRQIKGGNFIKYFNQTLQSKKYKNLISSKR